MFTLDGKHWFKGDPSCTELEPVTGLTPEECQELQESVERVMAAQADNPDYGYPGKYPYARKRGKPSSDEGVQNTLREAFGVKKPKPYPPPKRDPPDEGIITDEGLISIKEAVTEAFASEEIEENDGEHSEEVRSAFGGKPKKKGRSGTQEEIERAFNSRELHLDDPIPLKDLPAAKEESSPHQQLPSKEVLDAFGVQPGEKLLVESLESLVLDEAVLLESPDSLDEDYKITGTLVSADQPTRNHTYPRRILEKIVKEGLWKHGQIFLSHIARTTKDLTKLVGRVTRMWLEGPKLRFSALLSSKKIDQVPGLRDALEAKLIDISMASRGETESDNRTVKNINQVSLDLICDKGSIPASRESGIESVAKI